MTEIPEQNGSPSPASAPVKDRRLHVRQRVCSLTYVDLGEDNGGIALNVSEAGIRIQAAAALEAGPVTIRLQLPGTRKRLEVNAEVLWVGPSRKEAGLRFMELSEDALGQIRKWIAREATPEAFKEEEEEAEEEADSKSVAGPARVQPFVAEWMPADAGSPIDEERAVDDELVFENEFMAEDEEVVESEELPAAGAPEEFAEEERAPVETRAAAREAPLTPVPDARAAEVVPPAVEKQISIPAKAPEAPVSSFSGISGTHGTPSLGLGLTYPSRGMSRSSPSAGNAPLFVKPHRPPQVPEDEGWKSYRVKLQSGWFVAALVLLLALISFAAGMAVRRGALNSVIGQSDEPAHLQSAPPETTGIPPASAPVGEAAEGGTKPLALEIVDSSGRRWEIPAASAANRAEAKGARPSPASEDATPASSDAVPSRKTSAAQNSGQAATPAPAGAEKSSVPLLLTLPETAVSASGSVAIRSRDVVPVPPGSAEAAQQGRNLQIGQLTNLVEPVYPPDAQQRGIEGTVKLHLVIGVDGAIQSLEPRSGPEPLVQAAMAAVRAWKYNPTTLNGKPIETQEDVSFVFRLPK